MDQPPPPQPRQRQHQQQSPFSKVVAVLVLLALCFVLQVVIYSLEHSIATLKLDRANAAADSEKIAAQAEASSSSGNKSTSKPSTPATFQELHLDALSQNQQPLRIADAYWNQVLASGILDWSSGIDNTANNYYSTITIRSDAGTSQINGVEALQRAAQHGHATAQRYLANSLAAGFWTFANPQPNDALLVWNRTAVSDDMKDSSAAATAQSYLLWHMAAMNGDVDAAMTLAHRIAMTSTKSSASSSCPSQLPYLAAAANRVVDQLLASPDSRGYVRPATDRHTLHVVHLHGGTGSNVMDADNRPNENPETLQFYQLRAVQEGDAASAYTLARYYHTGIRGAPQNVTLALQYYELAANLSHWEAAGHAGNFYLRGIGVAQQDAVMAHKYYQMGVPFGLTGCRNKFQQKIQHQKNRKKQQQDGSGAPPIIDDVFLCDDNSLNGMGLLRLLGVPMVVPVDVNIAQEFFVLAMNQGNVDAAYNLAMMKLGWKTHYQAAEQDDDDDSHHNYLQPKSAQELFPLVVVPPAANEQQHPTVAEYKKILTDLTTAANGQHVLANHRLALLYEHGVQIPAKQQHTTTNTQQQTTTTVIAADCHKAAKHYRWILEHANPQHAQRLRTAYQQYTSGATAHSLRNYLAAAETGHALSQENAAFLLERGECLGLAKSTTDCARAAVRLWKAASAESGSAEASLRVGDFYYYGRLSSRDRRSTIAALPFGWAQYILFPEEYILPALWDGVVKRLVRQFLPLSQRSKPQEEAADTAAASEEQSCAADEGSEEGTCEVVAGSTGVAQGEADEEPNSSSGSSLESDLTMAAHYYQLAADRNASPRAHFNLGFMYQWGLGLKQDFPLAKRQYDLAIANGGNKKEAEVPVTLALSALSAHEYLVKLWMSWEEYWSVNNNNNVPAAPTDGESNESVPSRAEGTAAGQPIPSSHLAGKTKADVILSHLLSWESLLILLLTILLSKLLQYRARTRR